MTDSQPVGPESAELQAAKDVVLRFQAELDAAGEDEVGVVLGRHATPDYCWRGMHPFYEQHGAAAVAEVFWQPLRRAFAAPQRRPDVFMAGRNEVDGFGSVWVCSMGHLLGLFDAPWLGIPPTGKMAFLRYVEFHRVADGRIAETALFCDILGVMQQAGVHPLPPQTGAAFLTPGPRTHDGLLFTAQEAAEGRRTLALINRMVQDLTADAMASPQEQLARCWHDDMIWFGPAGIGATYTRQRYHEQHQGPFSEGLRDIRFNGHVCRFAEGHYGGFFGWANLSMQAAGGFMGLPASDRPTEMRVVDIYRREGEKLAENWIFIDLLHFLHLQGLDVLGRTRRILRTT